MKIKWEREEIGITVGRVVKGSIWYSIKANNVWRMMPLNNSVARTNLGTYVSIESAKMACDADLAMLIEESRPAPRRTTRTKKIGRTFHIS